MAIRLAPCLNAETLAVLRRIKQPVYTSASSRGECAVSRRQQPIPVSVWAERHRVIHTSSRPGQWRNDVTPYTAGIMDAGFAPSVRTIVLMKSPQTGGSECVHNCIGYTIDRQPGPVLYVYPDEITARENFRDRIIPMLQDSPRLRDLMSPNPDDTSSLRVAMAHTAIYAAWSGSASRLGNKPIRYLVLDELDKYQDSKNKEASSESLAEKRVTTWKERARIWKISTPTTETGPIYRAFCDAQVRFDFSVRCPHCNRPVVMSKEGIYWPKDAAVQDIFSQREGRYICPECGAMWTDSDRDAAVRAGSWVDHNKRIPLMDAISQIKPATIAFHVPAWISPFVSLSEIASRMAEYDKTKSRQAYRDLCNNYYGTPWTEQHETRDENAIFNLCDDRPRGAVPSPLPTSPDKPRVSCLLAGVDTQKGYFRYVIRAYGYGEEEESWLIQCGTLLSFAELESSILNAEFKDGMGKTYKVQGVMIDAMGNRTREVYEWAVHHRGQVFPWQGRQSLSQPYAVTPLEYYPGLKGQSIKIPGGLMLFRCDTTFFKSGIAQKLMIHPEDAGAFHLHSNADGELVQYTKEMTAEVWDDVKQAWINPMKRDNHFWDCEVMVSALAYIKCVRNLKPDAGSTRQAVQQRPQAAMPRKTHFGRY